MKHSRRRGLLPLFLVFLLVLGKTGYGQSDWEQLFYDDFQAGHVDQWELQEGWSLLQSDTNFMLKGENHYWANCRSGSSWLDYSFKCKVYIQQGAIHLNFRVSEKGRYMLGIGEDQLRLVRDEFWGTYTDLATREYPFTLETWHDVEVIAKQKALQVFINGELMIQVWDERAMEMGSIAFESLDSSLVYVDQVEVRGAPQLDPPEGYDWLRTGGPPGGLGYDIRIDPNNPDIVFVTDNPSGMNKSYNGGLTWHQKNQGITARTGTSLEGIPVFSATIDPGNPNILWCGTQNTKGIFKSVDRGETWTRKDQGVEAGDEISFRGFGIHPSNSDIVFGAAEIATEHQGKEFNKTQGKIFKTTDGGENWYEVWEGNNLARVVLFDYLHPDTVYCSTGIFDREAYDSDWDAQTHGGEGVLRSFDGGETWSKANTGIENLYIGYLEMHPTDPQIIYAASGNFIYHMEGKGYIYKTTNGGNSWEEMLVGRCFSAVTVSKSNPEVVYALDGDACYRSDNGGVSWEKYFNPSEGTWGPPGNKPGIPISAAVHPENENKLFVNNYNGGNFVSTDGGKTWVNSSSGYTGADIRDIHVDPDHPARVYAVGRNGIFKTENGGQQWIGKTFGVAGLEFMRISVPDTDFENVFGVVDGLLTTEDGGNTWNFHMIAPEEVEENGGFQTFSDLQVAPSDPTIIYMGTGHVQNIGNIEPDGRPGRGMFKSVDRGLDWIPINTGLETGSRIINSITVHPDTAEIVYIGTFSDGIYKTTNGGVSWEAKNQGLGSSDIRCIAMDPNHPNLLYAGSGNGFGIYKSTNGGQLWTESNYGIHLKCPSYLSPFGRAVEGMDLDSYDPIKKYQEYNSGSWTKVLDLVIDPSDTRRIYAADLGTGIHFSENGGASWARINSGIALRAPTSLSISRDGTVLYAGISGDGVLKLVLENKAPFFQLTIPDSGDTVTVFRGDTAEFSVLAFDLNDDSIRYAWTLDDIGQEGFNSAVFLLESAGMELGFYDLSVSISDGDTSSMNQWVVQVREISTDLHSDPETGLVQEEAIRIYPNPFTGFQHISYLLPFDARVSIEVFDVTGKQVRSLRNSHESAGVHALQWDGRDQNELVLPVGIYILRFVYRSSAEKIIQERKVVYTY